MTRKQLTREFAQKRISQNNLTTTTTQSKKQMKSFNLRVISLRFSFVSLCKHNVCTQKGTVIICKHGLYKTQTRNILYK